MLDRTSYLTDRAAELDDAHLTEVTIGLPDGPGGRFRALGKVRTTLRGGLGWANRAARRLAEDAEARLLDPAAQPAAIRVSRGLSGSTVLLDYDVADRRGVSRPLRVILQTRDLA